MHPLVSLLRSRAASLAAPMAERAAHWGLRFTQPDGSARDIPLVGTPVIVEPDVLRDRQQLASLLASAGVKAAEVLLKRPEGEVLRAAFSPIEREVLAAAGARVSTLAITRVDYFVGAGNHPWALELNTTIPAMSGYSDIAARTFIESLGALGGLDSAAQTRLLASNGSNAGALYQALLRGFAQARGGRSPERIALLCRRNDAQLTELRYCAQRFRELGTEAEIVFPDEMTLGDDAIAARGLRFDLVFRHLFVRRLEEIDAPNVRALFRNRGPAVLLNPPSAQAEAKASFALLSECVHDEAIAAQVGLTDAERHAVA